MRYNKFVLFTAIAALALTAVLTRPALANESNNEARLKRFEHAGSSQSLSISSKGVVEVNGVKIASINGLVLTVNSNWGSTEFTWKIKVLDNAKFIRRYSEKSTLAELSVGDFISVRGTLDTNASQPTVNATWIKDWSIQTYNSTFRGTIESINTDAGRMVVATNNTKITIFASDTTKVKRGNTIIKFSDLVLGEKVTTYGLYNNQNVSLQATSIVANQPKKQVFNGMLKTLSDVNKPTSLVMTIGAQDYRVYIAADTSILNSRWLRTTLNNFTADNALQVYGSVRPVMNSETSIDATIVRNLSLK